MRTPGKMIRAVIFAAAASGKRLPRNVDIARAVSCDECTVRRVLDRMQDADEVHVTNDGRRRRVALGTNCG